MYRNRSQISSSCGSSSLRPLAACSTGINGRAHTSVLEAGVVYRFREQGVTGLVCSGELDACWVRGTSTGDVDLETRNVRLWLSCAGVKGNCFGSDEVVSGGDVGRDFKVLAVYFKSSRCIWMVRANRTSEGSLAAVRVENLSSPRSSRASVSILSNLEEACL